jgi:hypothetical protein
MKIRLIRSETDYDATLAEIERLWGAPQELPRAIRSMCF